MAQTTLGLMLKRLFLKDEPLESAYDPDRPVPGEPPLSETVAPPLVMLVPGVAGVSIYQMRSFRDAHAAAAFIEACNPYRIYKEGIIAFWATHEKPPDDADAECAVLVRTEPSSDLVHPYAFTDSESATSYVRFRIEETGESLESFVLHWAAPIRINANPSGEVRLEPSSPPRLPRRQELTVEQRPLEAPEPQVLNEAEPRIVTETPVIEAEIKVPLEFRADVAEAEEDPPSATHRSGVAASSTDLPIASQTRWSRKPARRKAPAKVKAHVLALGLLGYGARQIEDELHAMFPGDRVPAYATIVRWLRRAGISRSNLKKWETMSEHAMRILEKRLAELDGAPLEEVARVAALLEGMRRK